MKKSVKITLWIIAAITALFLAVFSAYLIITSGTKLDESKLNGCEKTITIYDSEQTKIKDVSQFSKRSSVDVNQLNKDTINAFIASEDKTFFTHNGINFKRIVKALYKNVTSRSFKEGASTISQQLIKNTHLNNDKTITRKLKEIKLSRQLEKQYTKEEILQMYLNTIYFGHNCYGLENAAKFYFGVSANQLNLEQSATIVGLLTSPNNNSPFKNPEKCIQRRNIVLKSMLNCGYIDNLTYEKTINLPLSAQKSLSNSDYSDYVTEVFEELEEIAIDPYANYCNLKIFTNLDKQAQTAVERLNFEYDGAVIIRTVGGGISAYRTTCRDIKRQIGSTAKPIFVYAPAINEKKIHLFTKINDEPINFNGYAPENYDKKYRGYVSVEEAITQSLNVPAVKTLNSLTLNQATKYAEKMRIKLGEDDKNLSLALGAMREGLTIKELCDCYTVLPAQGNYTNSTFIDKITDENGKILYQSKPTIRPVFSKGTTSLINQALINATKMGTAKRLQGYNFDIACKTGTCGTKEGNTDAYAMLYTSQHCIGIWAGDRNNKKLEITGGGYCCNLAKEVLNSIYKDKNVPPIDQESGTKTIEIDKNEYEKNNKITLCDDVSPTLSRIKVRCLDDNLPIEKSSKFSKPTIKKPTITVNNNSICILLCHAEYYEYLIKRRNNGNYLTVFDGNWKETICETLPNGEYEYSVTPYYTFGGKKFFGDEIILPKIKIENEVAENLPNEEIPDIVNKDWFDINF